MTLAKALANGLPLGAMLATEAVAGAFGPGSHASTFGGTPIVTAASLAVVRTMDRQDIPGRCAEMGAYFKSRLEWLRDRHEAIEDVRGTGLLLGMKMKVDGDPLVNACLERGYLINCIQGAILRFVPPLTSSKKSTSTGLWTAWTSSSGRIRTQEHKPQGEDRVKKSKKWCWPIPEGSTPP